MNNIESLNQNIINCKDFKEINKDNILTLQEIIKCNSKIYKEAKEYII